MAKLSEKKRDSLKGSTFGLPEERKIDRKADAILKD